MNSNESIEIESKGFKLKVKQPSWKGVIIILIVVSFLIIMKYGSTIFGQNPQLKEKDTIFEQVVFPETSGFLVSSGLKT